MGSVVYAGECPNCGKTATFDDYYRTGELFVYCWHCGLYYTKITAPFYTYEESQEGGFGIFSRVNSNGLGSVIRLKENLSVKELEELAELFNAEDTDISKSYLVTFQEGKFTCILGELPEDFLLSFKEFTEKFNEDKRILHYLWS